MADSGEVISAISRKLALATTLNAIEAESIEKTITLGFKKVGEKIQFWIHNPSFIPRDVQLQIFKRSYSTKGTNRGLGTYSMKLLSAYLDGTVWFESSEENGTTFFAEYPIEITSIEVKKTNF